MNIIRGLLIAIIVGALTYFCIANNIYVPVNLGAQIVDIWLPLLVLGSFALGFLPVWAWLSADRMMLRRRITKLEGSLAQTETDLAQAQAERLSMPATAAMVHPAPPPGT